MSLIPLFVSWFSLVHKAAEWFITEWGGAPARTCRQSVTIGSKGMNEDRIHLSGTPDERLVGRDEIGSTLIPLWVNDNAAHVAIQCIVVCLH